MPIPLEEAKRRFCLPQKASATSASLAEAKQSLRNGQFSHGTHRERLSAVVSQRQAVATMTQELKVAHPGLFDDLFVDEPDAVTKLPGPPGSEALRRMHKELQEHQRESQGVSELNSLMQQLATHNRTRGLDGVSSIRHGPRAMPKETGAIAMAEIECQVLLSYVMQACAALDPSVRPVPETDDMYVSQQTSRQEASQHTARMPASLNATSIVGGANVVAHESRVAGGRISSGSGSKSGSHAASASRSRSTPSSGNAHSSTMLQHSVASDVVSQRAASPNPKSSSSGTRGSQNPPPHEASVRTSVTSPDASDFGFETRGNVRFDETSIAAAEARRATLQHDGGLGRSETDLGATAPGPGTSATMTDQPTVTEQPTSFAVGAEPSQAKSEPSVLRKPTAKFSKKPKSKGWCMSNDAV